MKTINLSLDTSKTDINNPKYIIRQGDGNFQTLRATVTSNGEPTDLTNMEISFNGTTSANHKVIDYTINRVDALGGIFEWTPNKAVGSDIGNFKEAYFRFVQDDKTASTASFKIVVISSVDLTNDQAKDYVSVVDGLVYSAKEKTERQLSDNTAALVNQLANSQKQFSEQLSDNQNKVDTQFNLNQSKIDKQMSDNQIAIINQLSDNKSKLDTQISNSQFQITKQISDSQNKIDSQLTDTNNKINNQITSGQQAIDKQVNDNKQLIDSQLADVKQKIADSVAAFNTQSNATTNVVSSAKNEIDTKLSVFNTQINNKVDNVSKALDVINQNIKSNNYADLNKDNSFQKNVTIAGKTSTSDMQINGNLEVNSTSSFNGDLNVKGAVHGKSDYAISADVANTINENSDIRVHSLETSQNLYTNGIALHRGTMQVQGTTTIGGKLTTTGGHDADTIGVNGLTELRGDTIAQKIDVFGPIFAHSTIKGIVETYNFNALGIDIYLTKSSQNVSFTMLGIPTYATPAYSVLGELIIPAGFRPKTIVTVGVENAFDNKLVAVFPDGTARMMAKSLNNSNVQGGTSWVTPDW